MSLYRVITKEIVSTFYKTQTIQDIDAHMHGFVEKLWKFVIATYRFRCMHP
jgi:hypothetical protein